jgi:small-conductance mechanosensitive channel
MTLRPWGENTSLFQEQEMALCVRPRSHIFFCAAALFLALICLLCPLQVKAQEETAQPEKKETAQAKQDFPGRIEIIPRAAVIDAKLAEAHAQVQKAETLSPVYGILDLVEGRLGELEKRYTNWEEIKSWRLNRLRNAESDYADLAEQQKGQLIIIQTQLQIMEDLLSTWEKEKAYWQEWQEVLNKKSVIYPEEAFERILAGIDKLLERVISVGGELIKAQQKYSSGQAIITGRLIAINKTQNSIRKETFSRNSYSLLEPRYYRQFNRGLFTDFIRSLGTNIRPPHSFYKDRGLGIVLQAIIILIITQLLINRSKLSKPIAEEWRFLFRRPLAGAIFINIIVVGNFTQQYQGLPPIWRWLLFVIATIVAIRLINVLYQEPLEKKVVKIIGVIFIVTESLQTFGVPEPLLQLYDVLLCAAAIPLCWQLISRRHKELSKQRFLLYLVLGLASVGLTASMLGFERFSSMLIHATLTTFIILIIVRIALRLLSGGIESFMQLEWMRNRSFMQVLGLSEATRKLQALTKIIILVNAALVFLVIWKVFDHFQDARDTIMSHEFIFGELTLSVKMVLLVIVILYLTSLFSWVLQAFVDSQVMTPRKMDRGIKESLKRLIHYGLFTLGFLIAVSIAGLELQKLTILAGALGVGIGFGLQNIVNNFVSGLILLFERPVKVGDIINIDQDWGTITKIGLRSTVFETFDKSEIIVPNADLIAQKVTNWTFSSKMARVVLPVGVAYGSPLEKVLEVLNKAAKEHPEVLPDPQPNSIFEGFGNSSIDFQLRFWVRTIDERLRIRTEVAVIVDRLFREESIVIAFPQLDLHLRSSDSDLQPLGGEKFTKSRTETEGNPG